MNDFFKHFKVDNIDTHILWWVLAIILTTVLASKYLSTYIAKFIFVLLKKLGRQPLEEPYYNFLVQPLRLFVSGLIILFSLEKIVLRSYVKSYSIYSSVTVGSLLNFFSSGIIVCLFIWFLLKTIDYLAAILEVKADKTIGYDDDQLIVFFKDFFKIVVSIIGILLLIKYALGQPIGNLLTGLSIVGAAIALATKESLENLIASFIIFFDKPFITGHFVKVHNVEGTVERIGLRSTRIRTIDKTYVTVPNKQMVDSIVDNFTKRTKQKYAAELLLDTHTPPNKLVQLVDAIKELLTLEKDNFPKQVYVGDILPTGIKVSAFTYFDNCTDDQLRKTKERINLAILKKLEELDIHLHEIK
jgi:MscS family membrane protein